MDPRRQGRATMRVRPCFAMRGSPYLMASGALITNPGNCAACSEVGCGIGSREHPEETFAVTLHLANMQGDIIQDIHIRWQK